jgi:chromosome segregation ATPase
MKVASIAKNIITAYGVEPDQVHGAAMAAFIYRTHLVGELNDLHTQIEDLKEKLKVLKKYRKVKHIGEELKALGGKDEKKYRKEHSGEIAEYYETRKEVLELYPSGTIPKVENLEKQITSLQKKLAKKNTEYNQADKKSRELYEATRTIEEYLRHEQSRGQQQKRKRNDLE